MIYRCYRNILNNNSKCNIIQAVQNLIINQVIDLMDWTIPNCFYWSNKIIPVQTLIKPPQTEQINESNTDSEVLRKISENESSQSYEPSTFVISNQCSLQDLGYGIIEQLRKQDKLLLQLELKSKSMDARLLEKQSRLKSLKQIVSRSLSPVQMLNEQFNKFQPTCCLLLTQKPAAYRINKKINLEFKVLDENQTLDQSQVQFSLILYDSGTPPARLQSRAVQQTKCVIRNGIGKFQFKIKKASSKQCPGGEYIFVITPTDAQDGRIYKTLIIGGIKVKTKL